MDKVDLDITREIPLKHIIDLNLFKPPLNTKEGFTDAVMKMGCGENLPKFFPDIPEVFNRIANPNIVMNNDYCDHLLTLPVELYNSDTYENNLALRGPMEEIIIANEIERYKSSLARNYIQGKNWSKNFKKRFRAIYPKAGPIEREVMNKLKVGFNIKEQNYKGEKLA